ncbi:MAG: 1-deoxy-D-xylulose-5-phosphate reductoisomerase [Muribaculaceae bacterium]|nr:1-deoxy-D-xylulose-5-phosphate reductoisomerase [Muribaculaceae bacterium]
MKNIAVLGSTGSIGTQTLDIIEAHPDIFKANVLTANKNWELLAKQALKFRPSLVVITDESYYKNLKEALKDTKIKVECGTESLALAPTLEEVDIVVTALVGYSGLIPTVNAIKRGKTIALANKETLVVAGEIITTLAKENNVNILPVDSEHSAIFQCLNGEEHKNMSKILLTASGGPFRSLSKEDLKHVTVKQALNHPNWDMGAKVTIDSASMMNKGFEMIEAKWLFNCNPDDIEILVHPQSLVHSMVQFCDGSVKAQIGIPDMRIPIQYALSYPERLNSPQFILDWSKVNQLTFEKPDMEKFPLLRLAFEAIHKGGNMPCILNAANEIANKAFLDEKISFTMMSSLVEAIMTSAHFIQNPSLEDLIETNKETRKLSQKWIETH